MHRPSIAVVLVIAALTVAGPHETASAGPDGAAKFREAAGREAAGDTAGAAAAFVAVADLHPADPFADDALMKAARLYGERLSNPQRAVELFERVLREYPDSRLARRARARRDALRDRLGPDDGFAAAVAEFQRIQREYPTRGPLASITDMEALLAEHPDYPARGEVLLWIGSAYERTGRLTEAAAAYRTAAAAYADTRLGRTAKKAEGDVLLARGDFEGAEDAYDQLAGAPGFERAVAASRERLSVQRRRARLLDVAWIALAVFALAMLAIVRRGAGSWSGFARTLVRPPAELLYLAPVVGLLVLSSLSVNELVGTAIVTICVGSLVITWLSGAALEVARRGGRVTGVRALGQAVASAAAVLALVYIAVKRERVLDMILETWRHGPDPG